MIRRSTKEELQAQNFQIEPHTTWLGYDGDWWAYELGGKIVACLVVRTVRNRYVVAGVYTDPAYRGRGIMHILLGYVANTAYKDASLYAGCLISSKHIFEDVGFVHYRTVPYKHGTQYLVKREVKQCR